MKFFEGIKYKNFKTRFILHDFRVKDTIDLYCNNDIYFQNMTFEKINKYFILLMKIVFLLFTLLFAGSIYLFSQTFILYDYKKISFDFFVMFFINVVFFFYLLILITVLVALFKQSNKLRIYMLLFIPIIPVLFLGIHVFQSRGFNYMDIYLFILLYLFYFFITAVFMVKLSNDIIGYVVGKEMGSMDDDYFAISVMFKPIKDEEQADNLLKNIIVNLLNYNFNKVNSIYYNKKTYEVLNYKKKNTYKNILLTDIYIEVTDDLKLINIVDNYDIDKNVWKCLFIYQYFDNGDKIESIPSTDNAVYLAIKGILPKDTLIHYYKNKDTTPSEIRALHHELFQKYFILRYGTLIDKAKTKLEDVLIRLKEPYKKALKYGFYLVIVLFIIIYLYTYLNFEQFLLIILGLPPFVHYSIKIYEWLVLKKKE